MAEIDNHNNTDELSKIPVLQERIMTGTSKDGFTSSYCISNSYAGILRISPNSAATLIDKNDIGIESDELSKYINYSDNPTLLMSKQFLPVSSSDGVMLNMRFFKNAVEYDNLYVIGRIKANEISIFNNGKNKFKLNDCELPNYFNKKASSDDNEFIINMKKGSLTFEYTSTQELISKLVRHSLLSRGSLPTGSIHFIPVTLEQYEALLNANGNGHNINESHSLIRDFLLCDGSLYNNKDFPELAKILYKEHITYWEAADEEDIMVRKEMDNNYAETKKFRVPDLRSMFVRATIPQIECLTKADNYPLFKDTGYWQIDSSKNQEIIRDKGEDKHYHYIVLDNKSKYVNGTHNYNANTPSWNDGSSKYMKFPVIEEKSESIDGYYFSKEDGPLPLAKFGNTYHVRGNGVVARTSLCKNECKSLTCVYDGNKDGGPFSVIFGPRTNLNYSSGKVGCMGADKTCGYVLSSDYSSDKKSLTLDNYLGRSSWNIDMSIKEDENWSPDEIKKNSYKSDNYIVNIENKKFMNLENAPEFYACLPFIKI